MSKKGVLLMEKWCKMRVKRYVCVCNVGLVSLGVFVLDGNAAMRRNRGVVSVLPGPRGSADFWVVRIRTVAMTGLDKTQDATLYHTMREGIRWSLPFPFPSNHHRSVRINILMLWPPVQLPYK